MKPPIRLPRPLLFAAALSVSLSPSHSAEQKSKADPEKSEAVLISETRQLTFEGKRAGEGYFGADGKSMIFQSERVSDNPFFQIYTMDLETGDTQQVSPGHGKSTCAWLHPDGKKAIYASTQDDPDAREKQQAEIELRKSGKQKRYSWDYDPTYEIQEYDFSSKKYRNLTNTLGYDAEGCYSPDGKHILFASNRAGYTDKLNTEDQQWFEKNPSFMMDLYLMDADGKNVKRLTTSPGYDGGPFFNADGSKICWRRFSREGDTAEIFTMNIDGSGEQQLTHLKAMSWAPYFHPSGDYLIFATNLQGFANFELYLVDTSGKKAPVRVTYTDGFDGLPAFSPDGKTLSWTSNRTSGKKSQIFRAQWNHQAARTLLGLDGEKTTTALVESKSPKTHAPKLLTTSDDITEDDLHQHIAYLASEELEGRLTGTAGARLATAYVADLFQDLGLAPAGTDNSYFQDFEFTAGVDLGADNQLELQNSKAAKNKKITADQDWRPLSFSKTGTIEKSAIAFAGYGIELKASTDADGKKFDTYTSYYHLDVTDKWVMVFRYSPEDVSKEQSHRFARSSALRYKALTARQKGARGIIFVTGPNSKSKSELTRLTFDASMADSGIAAISITREVATQLLKGSGKTLKTLQDQLDQGKMAAGFQIPDASLSAHIDIKQEKRIGRNVLARLISDDAEAQKRPAIILGAHVDHLGHGESQGSLAHDDEKNAIHYGADDNASGTAAMLEIAQYLVAQKKAGKLKMKRDIIFAAWSGEELGLIGSSHYVKQQTDGKKAHPHAKAPELSQHLAACLNLDMVGRLKKNLVLQGVGSSSVWTGEIERRNVPVGLPIVTQKDTYLATDATSFYLRGVPILSAFTGAHEDYHSPRDTVDKINFPGTQKISRLMALIARGLITRDKAPDYIKVDPPKNKGSRGGLRAYLGTVPDYAQGDIVGVKLSGVAQKGPAAKAGIQSGDVIMKLGDKEIKNIYDYTYVIGEVKIGEEVAIEILRDGKRLKLKITPGSRD
ncbi:MAG: M28 family peptidase [Verrucomicrobiales bacterium]|nr:M28 family peptidase [Verrucomicrobiales bacterium]